MTMFDGRTKLANEVVGEVRNLLGAKVFETVIPRSTKLADAPRFGKPMIHYGKHNAGVARMNCSRRSFRHGWAWHKWKYNQQ